MKCLNCQGELELNAQNNYGRCIECKSIFSIFNNDLYPFPIDESVRATMELALGFSSADNASATVVEPPKNCVSCQAKLEIIEKEGSTFARCTSCGILYNFNGTYYTPIHVNPPGGGWNAEFQAIFEEKLGFPYKLRKKVIGLPE